MQSQLYGMKGRGFSCFVFMTRWDKWGLTQLYFSGTIFTRNSNGALLPPCFPCRWATRTLAPWNSWWTNMASTTSSKSTPGSKLSTRSPKKSLSKQMFSICMGLRAGFGSWTVAAPVFREFVCFIICSQTRCRRSSEEWMVGGTEEEVWAQRGKKGDFYKAWEGRTGGISEERSREMRSDGEVRDDGNEGVRWKGSWKI